MQKMAIILATLAMAAGGVATPVLAAPYLSFNGGALWAEDSDLSVKGHNSSGEHTYDLGYMIDIAIGNTYANGLRAELEIPYRFNDVDEFSMEGSSPEEFDREISSLALMANLYYDLDTGTAWKPFAGAGIGYALMQVEGWHDHHDADVFAYQVMAGCGYAISKKIIVDLQYRFYATEDPEFETRDDPELGHIRIESEYMTQSIMLGLRYFF